MRRLFVLLVLLVPLGADAQQAAKVPRVGVLVPGSPPAHRSLEQFRQGLQELGYMEGRNIALELRWEAGKPARSRALADELVRLKVDVIVAGTTVSADAARNATGTIPIVMAAGPYALETGLISSLARPGGNVTGVSLLTRELTEKRLQLLREAVPWASRVAFLSNPLGSPVVAAIRQDHEAAARALGIELQTIEVREENFERAFQSAVRAGANAVILSQGPIFATHQARIAALALRHRLAVISGETGSAEAGALLYYGSDIPGGWRRAAAYVDRILKGAKPADLPVEQPTKFQLVVNLKTAKALGLTIPQSILIRADEVIR